MIPPWFQHAYIERRLLNDDTISYHPFFYDSVIFSWERGSDPYVNDTERNGCSHPFFQGLYGADDFWQQLLIKTNYFLGWCFLFCIYFHYRKNSNHPFFEVTVPFLLVLPLFVTRCHSLSFVVIRCHSLSLAVIHCATRCHSLSFVLTRGHSMCLSSVFLETILIQDRLTLWYVSVISFC